MTSFSVFFLQAYINTKRLSVTEINTLVPQVFESPAAATATGRTCPEKMEMGPPYRQVDPKSAVVNGGYNGITPISRVFFKPQGIPLIFGHFIRGCYNSTEKTFVAGPSLSVFQSPPASYLGFGGVSLTPSRGLLCKRWFWGDPLTAIVT